MCRNTYMATAVCCWCDLVAVEGAVMDHKICLSFLTLVQLFTFVFQILSLLNGSTVFLCLVRQVSQP